MPQLQSHSRLCSLRCNPAEQPVYWPEVVVSRWPGTYAPFRAKFVMTPWSYKRVYNTGILFSFVFALTSLGSDNVIIYLDSLNTGLRLAPPNRENGGYHLEPIPDHPLNKVDNPDSLATLIKEIHSKGFEWKNGFLLDLLKFFSSKIQPSEQQDNKLGDLIFDVSVIGDWTKAAQVLSHACEARSNTISLGNLHWPDSLTRLDFGYMVTYEGHYSINKEKVELYLGVYPNEDQQQESPLLIEQDTKLPSAIIQAVFSRVESKVTLQMINIVPPKLEANVMERAGIIAREVQSSSEAFYHMSEMHLLSLKNGSLKIERLPCSMTTSHSASLGGAIGTQCGSYMFSTAAAQPVIACGIVGAVCAGWRAYQLYNNNPSRIALREVNSKLQSIAIRSRPERLISPDSELWGVFTCQPQAVQSATRVRQAPLICNAPGAGFTTEREVFSLSASGLRQRK